MAIKIGGVSFYESDLCAAAGPFLLKTTEIKQVNPSYSLIQHYCVLAIKRMVLSQILCTVDEHININKMQVYIM